VCGEEILSINSAKFEVGLNEGLRSWDLNRSREIPMAKEFQSANSFLSLVFIERSEDKRGREQSCSARRLLSLV
jgi:hypothetical protein